MLKSKLRTSAQIHGVCIYIYLYIYIYFYYKMPLKKVLYVHVCVHVFLNEETVNFPQGLERNLIIFPLEQFLV